MDLSAFTDLVYLKIQDCKLTKLPTGYPTGINSVTIAGNNIKSLEGIENLINNTAIDVINLGNNQIEDISSFEKCRQPGGSNLYMLQLSGNKISHLTPLKNIKVDSLWLDENQISDLTGISGNNDIVYLELGKNQTSDLSPLAKVTTIDNLRLSGNNISDVKVLSQLPNLITLELSGNQISDSEQFVNLESLEILVL